MDKYDKAWEWYRKLIKPQQNNMDDYVLDCWDYYRQELKNRNVNNPAHCAAYLVIADLLFCLLTAEDKPEEEKEEPQEPQPQPRYLNDGKG